MKRFVLDASISLAPFLDDPVADLAIRIHRDLERGARAVVPALWRFEIANGFAIAERRGALTHLYIERCLVNVEILMASAIEVSETIVTLRQTLAVARTFRLSAYDSIYLETARIERLPLATLDRALAAAASKAGVETMS